MKELEKTSTLTPASFNVGRVKLTRSQIEILDLINISVKSKTPITQDDINKAYASSLFPNGNGQILVWRGCGSNYRREFVDFTRWHEHKSKSWFKNNLSSCIIKGKLLVLPIIEIE